MGTLPVAPGDTLEVMVGGEGGHGDPGGNGGSEAGGFNGGGGGPFSGYLVAAGGGGASDVRSAPYGLGQRLIVAGGGGGAGAFGDGAGSLAGGGAAGGSGGPSDGIGSAGTGVTDGGGGGGGGGASATAVGAGGSAGIGLESGKAGGAGTLGQGGASGQGEPGSDGGGGGGGYYGGGGGGGGALNEGEPPLSGGGGGGGGGSSFVAAGATGALVTDGAQAGNGEVTITYSVSAPTAQVISPQGGGTYAVGQTVPTSFTCAEGAGGPGLTSCVDSTGHVGTTGTITGSLNTAAAGTGTYTVTATSEDGQTGAASIRYTVVAPPRSTSLPAITGTVKAGSTLTCSPGSWTADPTSYIYQWSRDGTPIAGATGQTYRVQAIDEGNTLTCAVAAVNVAGAGAPVISAGVRVGVPRVAHCPGATGKLSGDTLGLVKLGETKRQARKAFAHSSNRGRQFEDFFCLTPIGVRVGYASPRLMNTLPARQASRLAGRVIWISTASAYYALRGVRPGASVSAAAKKLRLGKVFHIGLNDWYFAPAGSAAAILKVRHGLVEEIGLADKQLTAGRAAQRHFLTSFS
jgi:hypothetical protein